MTQTAASLSRLRRRIRVVCLVLVPIVAVISTALALWSDASAGREFEPHPIFSGIGMIGWGFTVFVLSHPVLNWLERRADKRSVK